MAFLRCPTTAREFSTGIETEQQMFLDLPDVQARAGCPHCGEMHKWWPHDAWLSDQLPGQAALASDAKAQ
jgi:hypothetical protein